ncbi:MAG: hypothetical protein AAFX54_03495 [Pseudomonadota bacterium]
MSLSPSKAMRKSLLALFAVSIFGAASFNAALAHPRHQYNDGSPTDSQKLSEANQSRLDKLALRLNKKPENAEVAVAFARFATTQARRLGDATLLRQAGESLNPWEGVENPPIDVLLVRANMKQIDHRFDAALDDLNQVIKRSPANPQARLSRAFILSTIGRADDAAADCAALRVSVSIYIRETCRARVNGLVGAIDETATRMDALLSAVQSASPAERLFALSVAADIAERQRNSIAAEAYYREMWAIDSASVYMRAAYADFLLTQNRSEEAREVIGDAPHTEALLLLRILAADDPGDAAADSAAQELSIRMAVDHAERDFSHAREYARFALDHLDDAKLSLEMARENWRVQKEPVDARILVRSAIAANAPDLVADMRAWFAETGMRDHILEALLTQDHLEIKGEIPDAAHPHASVIE